MLYVEGVAVAVVVVVVVAWVGKKAALIQDCTPTSTITHTVCKAVEKEEVCSCAQTVHFILMFYLIELYMFYLLSICYLFGNVSYCIERYDFVLVGPYQDIVASLGSDYLAQEMLLFRRSWIVVG